MTDIAYQKRLLWAARLIRDVMTTLGSDAGLIWCRHHHAAMKKNLAAVQRQWNDEKRALRPKEGDHV
jgi:hypothetical protein